ncbi:MAG: thermonuclease family protein, partial [Kiloniellales bacterium]
EAALLAALPVWAQPAGPATVIDGNTLEVAGTRVRLFGIEAPDLDQPCRLRGRARPCGVIARAALKDLTAGAELRCRPKGHDAAGRALATCTADGYDVAEGMVYTGWALALEAAPPRYHALQRQAKKARRGLWLGEFVAPWEWRRRKQ